MRAAATDSMALLCNGHSIRVSLRLGGGRYAVIGRVAGIAVGNGFAESRPRLGRIDFPDTPRPASTIGADGSVIPCNVRKLLVNVT